MTRDRYPNLFLAGAPKCGTTSLAFYLGQHPDIFTPIVKEPVFFGSDLTSASRLDLNSYLQFYHEWDAETFAMDASTHYLYAEQAAQEIAAVSPDAQVIIMVRNPVEAAHSMYHQLRFNGAEKLDTFEASLEAEPQRAKDRQAIRFGFPENFLYRRIFAFSENVQRFEKWFGRDQVHVVFLDDVKADPAQEVTLLCRKLGLDEMAVQDFSFETKNAAKRPRFGWINTLARYPSERLRVVTRPFPKTLRLKVREHLARLNTAPATNPPLRAETRGLLAREFASEIDWLEDRFQRNLSHWRT